MPMSLKITLGVVIFQVASNALLGYLLLADINSAKDHGQERTGVDYFVTYASWVGASLLLAGALLTIGGIEWGRKTLICLEVIIGANGLFALFSGAFAGSVGIVLAVVIIRELTREAVLDWFDAKTDRPGRADIEMGGTASS
ncbi:hypothetical protein [Nocardia wallacei]|uniref:hypothetical protein n=1 Tax=Nocardia wallacei TaxID=480035 RepID=UPI00245910FA|nr:hypothetical protein [Nocardia wallacei]